MSGSKNLLYRCLLPAAPRVSGMHLTHSEGHPLSNAGGFESLLRRHHVSGGAFLFRTGNQESRLYTRAFHTDVSPSGNTFFRVASVTKMATALLAFRMQDLGFLDLNAPISSFLPDAASVPDLQGVTASHLLSHTSGLSDPPDLESMLLHRKPYPNAVAGQRICAPGACFHYSNLGFGLLGCLFESVLNQPLGKIYQDYLFVPLGMRASLEGCSLPEQSIMPVIRILPYHPGTSLAVTSLGRIPLSAPDPLLHYGHTAGSLYTDLMSLARLLVCIRDGGAPLLSSGLPMKRQTASYGRLSPQLSYGSGLLIIRDSRISSGPVYGHQGFAYGCVDGAFWEEDTGNLMISLNGGCSEARVGRLGLMNHDFCRFAFRKELPLWK